MPGITDQKGISKKLYDFIGILSDAGIPVSTSEILDMFAALEHVDYDDRPVFKQALSTTLVKDFTDIPVFDKCFSAFFENRFGAENSSVIPDGDEPAKNNLQDILYYSDELEKFLESMPPEQLEQSSEDLMRSFLENRNDASGSPPGSSGSAASGRGEKGDRGDKESRKFLLERIIQWKRERKIGRDIRQREEFLLNKNIYQLAPEEIREMKELIRRFGQKLKNRITLRKKRVKHGALDIKRTIRDNLKNSGVLFKLSYRDKKVKKPRLVVMCDISSSVNQYSRFMLLLTYTLQGLFSKVRTFAFVSNMVEITALFREMDVDRALNHIFSDTNFTYGFRSNYGKCFDEFVKEYPDSLTSSTTVIILGDARNNYQDAGLDSFKIMQGRTKNLFWLNTEHVNVWNSADSIAGVYRPFCREMKEVKCFLDLSEFIDKLFV